MPNLIALGDYISSSLLEAVQDWHIKNKELTLYTTCQMLPKVLVFLRDNKKCSCKQLMDICGVDYPNREIRFEIVYHLLSLKHNHRVRVVVHTDEKDPIPTVTEIFHSADWWEREVWDMFGIVFKRHPDLRRILTDYNFKGHPLRKDFPLTGYTEVRYDEHQGKVVYEPVKLDQNFRSFDFLSPWEGMTTEMKDNIKQAQKKLIPDENIFEKNSQNEQIKTK